MTLKAEVELIEEEMKFIKDVFLSAINLIPSFNITDEKILPYGLRAHTRSISWIVEQVITQQAKFHAERLGVTDVDFNMPDFSARLHSYCRRESLFPKRKNS